MCPYVARYLVELALWERGSLVGYMALNTEPGDVHLQLTCHSEHYQN